MHPRDVRPRKAQKLRHLVLALAPDVNQTARQRVGCRQQPQPLLHCFDRLDFSRRLAFPPRSRSRGPFLLIPGQGSGTAAEPAHHPANSPTSRIAHNLEAPPLIRCCAYVAKFTFRTGSNVRAASTSAMYAVACSSSRAPSAAATYIRSPAIAPSAGKASPAPAGRRSARSDSCDAPRVSASATAAARTDPPRHPTAHQAAGHPPRGKISACSMALLPETDCSPRPTSESLVAEKRA